MLDESKLIFIISQPRGGSTLLQKILSNNEFVDTVSEPWLLLPFLNFYYPNLTSATYNFQVASVGLHDYLSKKDIESFFKEKLKKFLLEIYRTEKDGQYFIDKTPRYYEMVDKILNVFPNSRFIVLKRNPFASLCSMIFTWGNGKLNINEIKTFYRDFLIAPYNIQSFLDLNHNLKNIKEIQYEQLVDDPEKVTEELYNWLTIKFNSRVMDFSKNNKVAGIYGDDVYKTNSLGKVESSGIHSWKGKCNIEPLKSFFIDYNDYLTVDFIEKYGYEPLNWKKGFLNSNQKFKKLLKRSDINLK